MMTMIKKYRSWPVSLGILATLTGAAPAQMTAQSAADLVRQTVQNEITSNNGGKKFMFRDYREGLHGSQTKLIVETKGATAGMLVAVDGKPLTPEQRQAEDSRLANLVNNPEELKKKERAEKEDSNHTERIMRAFPGAFIFEYDGTVPGRAGVGSPDDELVRLKFRPNPSYDPPSHTEQVLTGMEGVILIDANKHRIAQIDGTLFKDVSFGWGILGRLNKGGKFIVEQGCVDGSDWELTRMTLPLPARNCCSRASTSN